MPAGRPKAIESPEELKSLFEAYKKWIQENPYLVHDFVGKDAVEVEKKKQRPLSWVGFEGYLARNGVLEHLGHYEQNRGEAYTEYVPIIRALKKECSSDIIEGAMAGVYNANLAARLEGLADKKELEAQVNIAPITGMEIK
jgi:hypothetical protein